MHTFLELILKNDKQLSNLKKNEFVYKKLCCFKQKFKKKFFHEIYLKIKEIPNFFLLEKFF